MDKIYTVQVYRIDGHEIVRSRTWGWFKTFEEAEEIILKNITDIYENDYYNYGVVNAIPPGICARPESKWYYADYLQMNKHNQPKVISTVSPFAKNMIFGGDFDE